MPFSNRLAQLWRDVPSAHHCYDITWSRALFVRSLDFPRDGPDATACEKLGTLPTGRSPSGPASSFHEMRSPFLLHPVARPARTDDAEFAAELGINPRTLTY